MLPIILAAAQAAEDECQQNQDIACKIVTSLGFFMQGTPGTYPSQTEKTLAKYKEGTQFNEKAKLNCWGCGGNHSWMRRGIITCPCSTKPQFSCRQKRSTTSKKTTSSKV
jgi:hypothetical protein